LATERDLGPVVVQRRGLVRLGEARKLLGIADGDILRMWVEDGRIVMEPADLVPRTERYLRQDEWAAMLQASLDDMRAGRMRSHDTVDGLLADLHAPDAN